MAEQNHHNQFRLPPLGMRIIKTGISVFICLLMNYFFNSEVALVSSLAAIVSMQSSLEGTMKKAISRSVGTALGGFAGIALLPLSMSVSDDLLYIMLMPVGMIAVSYLCLMMKMPASISICAYSYITVLIVPLGGNADGAYVDGLMRIADTAFGVIVSLLVNRYIDPPKYTALKDVTIPVNSLATVYNKISRLMPGPAQLVLVDTRLVEPQAVRTRPPVEATGMTTGALSGETVSLPVPTVFSSSNTLQSVYIDMDYSVRLFTLPQEDGYVSIPCESYPVMVGWHVDQDTRASYDMFAHDHSHHTARVIRKSHVS